MMDVTLPTHLNHPGYLVVLVTGGRHYAGDRVLRAALDSVAAICGKRQLRMVILQGGATGADRIARTWGWHNNKRVITERAQWGAPPPNHDRLAGFKRNQRMLDLHRPDICLAAPGGNGTADMVERCRAARPPVPVLDVE